VNRLTNAQEGRGGGAGRGGAGGDSGRRGHGRERGRGWRLKKGPDKRGPLFSECERERGERLEWAGRGNGPHARKKRRGKEREMGCGKLG
jgi:hypothetical protein